MIFNNDGNIEFKDSLGVQAVFKLDADGYPKPYTYGGEPCDSRMPLPPQVRFRLLKELMIAMRDHLNFYHTEEQP